VFLALQPLPAVLDPDDRSKTSPKADFTTTTPTTNFVVLLHLLVRFVGNRLLVPVCRTGVIQCASRKRKDAGHLETPAGRPVTFVADPRAFAPSDEVLYERPDDMSDYGWRWREALLKYNEDSSHNPLRLLPAWQLYDNPVYGRLAERIGVPNLFILSAGWGLIRADFLTPYYDITFSASAEAYKRRRQTDRYQDLNMLGPAAEDVVFLGGKEYLPLFCALTAGVKGKRVVFYNSGSAPAASACELRRFKTSMRTNWHYECANAFVNGELAGV
jgi:hypothetical protein